MDGEIINLLSDNVTLSITVRFNLDLLSSIFLLNVLVFHDGVELSVDLGASGVLKDRNDPASVMFNKEQLAFAIARMPSLEQYSDIAFNSLELLVAEESHI